MSDNFILDLDGQKVELPKITGTRDEKAIDIAKLRKQTGHVTMDIGYVNTASCFSEITFLNGEAGMLQYRGIPIEALASESHFLETSYLLLNDKLPSKSELEEFKTAIQDKGQLDKRVLQLIKSFAPSAHPMGSLSAALVALSGFYPDLAREDLSPKEVDEAIIFLIAQTKGILGAILRHSQGKDVVNSSSKLSYAEDFLSMMFPEKVKNWPADIAKAMDILFLLHADHEQNCSTTTVRTIGSAKGNICASVAGGVNALWGSLHGGANQAVVEMLEMIHKDGGDVEKYLAKAKNKEDSFRIMGFGHRVYKNFDPRAKIIKVFCKTVLESLNVNDPLLDIAHKLEEAALSDSYFIDRKLYPNVDFYSGLIYRALEIPTTMYTTLFALGRMPGWLAQWKEQREGKGRITRPRQIYMGKKDCDYTPIEQR